MVEMECDARECGEVKRMGEVAWVDGWVGGGRGGVYVD